MNLTKAREELLLGKTIYDMNLRVADYGRVSTDKDDQLNSLENQINYFSDLISSNKNWIHVNSYIDEGISGTSTQKRENFLQMIEDAKNNKIDLILTKEVSRFARNTIDSIKYTEELLKYGVIVLFISDNINTIYPDSEFRLTLMASLAQDEVRKLSERVKFGIRRSIKDGKVGGNGLTGYIKKDGKLIINYKEVPIIKKLFNLYATGQYSFNQISKELANNGYYTKKGLPFSPPTLKKMLTNPRYKGFYTANLSKIIDYKTHQKVKVAAEEQIIYKDKKGFVPAIIDEKIWDKANSIYNERKNHKSKVNLNKTNYISNSNYTSKLICKEHNKPYIRTASSKRKNNPVWQCNEYLRHGKKACLSPIIKECILDELFISTIKEFLNLNEIKKELIAQYENIKLEAKSNIKEQIDNQEKIKNNLITLLSKELITEEEYKKEKIKVNNHINSLKGSFNVKPNIKKITNHLINNYTLESNIKDYFNIFIKEVIIEKINNDRKKIFLTIRYNFNRRKQQKELTLY